MTTQKPRVLVLATPQGEVKGNAGFYSNIRRRNPNPSAPMITGLLKTSFREAGVDAEVTQVDARSDKFGEVKERVYAKFRAPYIDEELTKYYYGISPAAIEGLVRNSDIICFTSHFTGSSGVVKMFIREAKRMNPNAEVWIGGNDVPGPRQDSYRAAGADRFWVGDVFRSLPAYIHERWGGTVKSCSLDVDHKRRGTYMLPIPSYMGDIVYLTKFSDCAEGPYPGRD
ncbi:MAG TPA: hypothetical protein PKJ97_03970, partial [Candidatus Bilamarchaeaceae archaeon]|nr:hypothetical protein [Candidatus Bilamarchaeaceae archaeon]